MAKCLPIEPLIPTASHGRTRRLPGRSIRHVPLSCRRKARGCIGSSRRSVARLGRLLLRRVSVLVLLRLRILVLLRPLLCALLRGRRCDVFVRVALRRWTLGRAGLRRVAWGLGLLLRCVGGVLLPCWGSAGWSAVEGVPVVDGRIVVAC